jgi:hypothetical protein
MQRELHEPKVLAKLGKLLKLPAAVMEALLLCLHPDPTKRPDLAMLRGLQLSSRRYRGLDGWDRGEAVPPTVIDVFKITDDNSWSDEAVDAE